MGVFSRDIIAAGSRLFSDRITGVSLGTGVSTTYDVEVSGSDFLTVQGDLTGAALGDLVMTVQPFEEDGVTLSSVVLTPIAASSPANIFAGGHAYGIQKYDVTGIGRVRVFWKNNNAGTQTLTRGSWRASGF
jgi:hypothetical protein